jgi:hypothetical protein
MRFIKRYVSSLIVALYDLREEESGKNAPESSRLIYGVFFDDIDGEKPKYMDENTTQNK